MKQRFCHLAVAFIFSLSGLSIAMSGCQQANQGVISRAPVAYLSFEGNMAGISIFLDGDRMPDVKAGENNLLKIAPGRHLLRIERDGQLLVERRLFVGDGQTQVIAIPE